MSAQPAKQALVALGVTPAQVGVEHVASEVVREQAVGARLDEGQIAQPREHVVSVLEAEAVAEQRLGRDPRQGARLEGAAALTDRHDVDEPAQERGDEVGSERLDRGLAAGDDHVGDERQPQRVAVRDRDEAFARGFVDAARLQVAPALVGAEVPQRHHA